MSKAARFGIAGLMVLGLFGMTPAAMAKDGDVVKTGAAAQAARGSSS